MPIERGRTLLVLGRVRRPLKKRRAAKATLEEALSIFERVGSPRWCDRVWEEIDCLGLRPTARDGLTPSEERIARLAAEGLTNREVAVALYVSPSRARAQARAECAERSTNRSGTARRRAARALPPLPACAQANAPARD